MDQLHSIICQEYVHVSEQMKVRQHDPEETVRMEVVNCMLQVARKDVASTTDEMLTFIKERTLDKKVEYTFSNSPFSGLQLIHYCVKIEK